MDVIAQLLHGVRHVAVGASSPIPGSGALLARALSEVDSASSPTRVSILGSRTHNAFTNGGVELFDMAATGRIDAFFLGGGQIDGEANINLVGTGTYPRTEVRWPGSFGSAYLYHLIPRVILFREEHSRRVFVPRVDFVSASSIKRDADYRPGGPFALLTGLCLFRFNPVKRRFLLQSIHPGHSLEEVNDQTGFDFDLAQDMGQTPDPDTKRLALIRGRVRHEIAETYPHFASLLKA
ncbi:MAG: CoA synthetase [Betaproteobacteria bacterium]|nr:CoA synthetase [Betaproteobacteria bacterium]